MALEELRNDIMHEAKLAASALDKESESEARAIISNAKKLAEEAKKKAQADAGMEAEQRKRDALIATDMEASGTLSSAREEGIDMELKEFNALIAKKLREHEELLIKTALRNFAEIVPPDKSIATISKKYAGLAKQQHLAKVEQTEIDGIVLSSLDGKVSADASVDGLIAARSELIRETLSKAMQR